MEHKTKPTITILLATFNGELFLSKQIESIQNQTYNDWELVIRDDESTDSTLSIIREFVAKDKRIKLLKDDKTAGSACGNFSILFEWARINGGNYIMFADQDDIWLPFKVEKSYNHITQLENVKSSIVPTMCYSKFQFVDSEDSYIDTELNLPPLLDLNVLMNENYAWGCTIIINKRLADYISRIPADAVNHDYWIALVASALGQAVLIDDKLLLYRQHDANVSGNVGNMTLKKRVERYIVKRDMMLHPLYNNLHTLIMFLENYESLLTKHQRNMIYSFTTSYKKSFIALIYTMFKYKIFKIGFGKNLAYLYTIFLLRSKVVCLIVNE